MRLPGLRIFTSEGFEARYSRPWLLFTIPTIFGMTAIAIVAASMCLLGIIFAVILGVGVSAYRGKVAASKASAGCRRRKDNSAARIFSLEEAP